MLRSTPVQVPSVVKIAPGSVANAEAVPNRATSAGKTKAAARRLQIRLTVCDVIVILLLCSFRVVPAVQMSWLVLVHMGHSCTNSNRAKIRRGEYRGASLILE